MLDALLGFYSQIESTVSTTVASLILQYGGWGVLVGMFLESSVVPIPSELIFVTAGALGIDLVTITIFGTIGSTLGAAVGYYLGLKGGRPVIDKIGPYLFITHEKVSRAENFYNRHGGWAVLVSRLVPFIPFKVFSMPSGFPRCDFKTFIVFTFLGTIPRAFILAWIGSEIIKYKEQAYIAIAALILLAILYYVVKKKIIDKNGEKNREKNAEKKGEKKRI